MADHIGHALGRKVFPGRHGRIGTAFEDGRGQIPVVHQREQFARSQRRAQSTFAARAVTIRAVAPIEDRSRAVRWRRLPGDQIDHGLDGRRFQLPRAQIGDQVAGLLGAEFLPTGHGRIGTTAKDRIAEKLVGRHGQERRRAEPDAQAAFALGSVAAHAPSPVQLLAKLGIAAPLSSGWPNSIFWHITPRTLPSPSCSMRTGFVKR